MSYNKLVTTRDDMRNHPQWRVGYKDNTEGKLLPSREDCSYVPEYRLGWLHAEEDHVLFVSGTGDALS